MKKFENFCKALDNLQLVKAVKEPYDVMTMTGSVALFEICFEQSWKAMKEILLRHGYSAGQTTGSPKQIVKLAYSAGMVQDQDGWLKMLDSRNDVVHSYNEEIAKGIIEDVKRNYINLFDALKQEIEDKWL